MTDLLTRLKEATGPDRELDAAIYDALIGVNARDAKEWYGRGIGPTFSIDASLALVERMLPGHTAGFQPGIGSTTWARIYYVNAVEVQHIAEAKAKTAPLAILQSLFLALQETDQ